MSMETGDLMPLKPEVERPMPPEISFDPATGIFSGATSPGTTIKIESSDDKQSFTAKPCADGKWEVALGKPPRWYTVFTLWAEHMGSGAASEKVQFTFGGSTAKLKDIYVGGTFACGISDVPADVRVYGANGNLLGCAYAFGKNGSWNVKFLEKVAAGDRVCIIAKLPNGNNSMPVFAEVNAFSVEERCPSHFAGTGALPGDRIQIFDAGRTALLGTAKATATGAWSVSFDTPLAANKRVYIRRVHKNGTTAEGLTIFGFTSSVVSADIDGVNGQIAWGTGMPYYYVWVERHSNYGPVQTYGPVMISSNGSWYTNAPALGHGDKFKTITGNQNSNPEYATYYSCAEYLGGRPNPPHISTIDYSGATGYANAGTYVFISSTTYGAITTVLADKNGYWSLPSPWSVYGVNPTGQVFTFAMALDPNGTNVTSSSSANLASDPDDTVPAVPVMTQYDGYTFAGTEQTMPTVIKVFDIDQGSSITEEPMPVINNTWTSANSVLENLNNGGQPPIPYGDRVYPQARYIKSTGEPGATQDGKISYVGTQPSATTLAFPPEIDSVVSTDITGTSQINVYIKLTSNYQGQIADYPTTPFTTDGNWSIDIPAAMPSGTVFTAVAYYEADQPSDPYVKWVNHTTKTTPNITAVTTSSVTVNNLDQGPQQILGWRSSDGLKIVDSSLNPQPPAPTTQDPNPTYDPSTPFTLNFIGGNTLSAHDQLNLVSAFPNGGTMSPYNSKPEGYPQVQ